MKKILGILIIFSILILFSINCYAIEVREKDLIFNKSISYNFSYLTIDIIGENEYYVPLKIIDKKDKKDNVELQSGTVYKYFDAWIGTYRVKKAIIRCMINNSWIEDNDIVNIEFLQLNKTSKEWKILDGKIVDEDDDYTYLESETEYLSSFVIVGLSVEEGLETITLSGEIEEIEIIENDEDVNFTRIREKAKESPGFEYCIIIMVIFAIIYIKRRRINKVKEEQWIRN